MNKIHPKKLLNSKWTAVKPIKKQKHHIISDVEFDEDGNVTLCLIEAVFTKKTQEIDWRDLKNQSEWLQGWL